MRVVFHIISTGGGGGVSRATRYIAEREKDPTREGPGPRPLFSEDRDGLTYRKADRILDPVEGQPEKDDLMHLSVSFQEEDFEKLGHVYDDSFKLYKGPLKDNEGNVVLKEGEIIGNEDNVFKLNVKFLVEGAIGRTGLK